MANISTLLARILTTRYGKDMRQDLHDAIEATNNDTETALGKTLAFDNSTRKLTLKAKDNSVLSEATIPGGASGSTVTWNQIKQSGEKIATITIDNTSTDVYASSGGGGGGGAVDTVNGVAPDANGNVQLTPSDIGAAECESIGKFTDTRITESGDVRVTESGDVRESELDVVGYVDENTFSGDYNDLSNKPTIGTGTLTVIRGGGLSPLVFSANSTENKTVSCPQLPTLRTGTFTPNTLNVSSSNLIVRQYANIVNISGQISAILQAITNAGLRLGSISGVTLPPINISSEPTYTDPTGTTKFTEFKCDTNGDLWVTLTATASGGMNFNVNLTYIVV